MFFVDFEPGCCSILDVLDWITEVLSGFHSCHCPTKVRFLKFSYLCAFGHDFFLPNSTRRYCLKECRLISFKNDSVLIFFMSFSWTNVYLQVSDSLTLYFSIRLTLRYCHFVLLPNFYDQLCLCKSWTWLVNCRIRFVGS